jgi:hypothetical protein
VTDYLVYKQGGELKPKLYGHHEEEDFLLLNFVPGESLVVISGVVSAHPDNEAIRQAESYFRGEHQDQKRIDCWVAGALQRQACLKSQ